MRILVITKNGEKTEGVLSLKDESFIMVKTSESKVRSIHWNHIKEVKRVVKKEYQSINLDVFRKARE